MFEKPVDKRSWDNRAIDVSWCAPDGVTITACTVIVVSFVPPKWEGSADLASTLLESATASLDGLTASAVFKGGESKKRYLCKFRANFSDGVNREEKVVMVVVDDDHDAPV